MKTILLSTLGAALLIAGSLSASQAPNCAGNLAGNLVVGMDLTSTGPGAPWTSISNNVVVGFDVQVICQVAALLGYTGVTVLNIPNNCFNAAISAGTVPVIISKVPITPISLVNAFIKYNDITLNTAASGFGIVVNAQCCQLYQNIAAAISTLASDGTLARLRTQFNIVPNSFTPLSGLVPTACASTTASLPSRNAITTFILNFFCRVPCSPVAPTAVTVVPGC